MAIWNDFLNASKSGTESGLALARVLNEKQEAAAKLALARDQEDNQNALGYATLAAKEREVGQTAGDKLQAALAQNEAINAYRTGKLDQGQQTIDLKSSVADALNNYRTGVLGQKSDSAKDLSNYRSGKLDLGQQALDLKGQQIQNQSEQAAAKLAQNKLWYQGQYGNKLSPTDKMDYQNAQKILENSYSAIIKGGLTPDSDAYKMATNTIANSQSTIDRIKAKSPGGGTTTINSPTGSAADALTATPAGTINLGGGVTMGTGPSATPSAADALTSGTATNALPTAAPATNSYQVGRRYGNLRYLGGDPNDESSWEAAQ
jgi:hypothetical protein